MASVTSCTSVFVLPEAGERTPQVVLRRGVAHRRHLTGSHLEGLAQGADGLPQARRVASSVSNLNQRSSQIVLRLCPSQRLSLKHPFLEREPIGAGGFLQEFYAGLPLAEAHQGTPEVALRLRPIHRHLVPVPHL